ncbi:MAG: AMIN domain-containing protein [Candidatus Nanopelagicales bacterium]
MRRTWAWVAVVTALGASGPTALAALPSSAQVTAVRILPAAGRADVVIAVEGEVQVTDFSLETPHRIVLDLRGATVGFRAPTYDRQPRAGITNLRVSQHQPDVVRVVLDLDEAREYGVVRRPGALQISIVGPSDFAPWSSGALAVEATDSDELAGSASMASRPVAPAVTPVAAGALTQPPRSRISVSFVATPINEVIATFAEHSGRTFVFGPQVTGAITAEIANQPWDIALGKILQANGFSAVEDSTGIITIDSYSNIATRTSVEPLVSQVIPVNYAKVTELAETIKQLIAACASAPAGATAAATPPPSGGTPAPTLTSSTSCGRGTVATDVKTNTIIITETVSRLADIVRYVKDLDRRTPQVAIRAKIISVDRTATQELGVSYDVGTPTTFIQAVNPRFLPGGQQPVQGNFRVNLTGEAFAGVANANRLFRTSSALSLIFNTVLRGYNLTTFLDALAGEQLSDVQAEPSTTTIDNRKATLFAGSEIAFLLTPPVVPGQIQAVAPQIFLQRVGITLDVTPHVTANRQVSLEISAGQQSLLGTTEAGPSISERTATNEVLVADGETVVIAGLTQTQVSTIKSGIPILMNLPWIGRAFRQERLEDRKQDLLILVTPHIVDEGEVVRGVPEAP